MYDFLIEKIKDVAKQSDDKVHKLKTLLMHANKHISELKENSTEKDKQITHLSSTLEMTHNLSENLKKQIDSKTGKLIECL
jgi:uncharacterized phage infection (PIP) family protein YhgE